MERREQKYVDTLQQLYPMDKTMLDRGKVEFHYLGVLIALATRPDLLDKTLPFGGKADAAALLSAPIGLDQKRLDPKVIEELAPFREHFAGIQRAWALLSGYEEPPCPPNKRLECVVKVTKYLQRDGDCPMMD